MKKLIQYLKDERYTLIFEVIVVIIGMLLALTVDGIRDDKQEQEKLEKAFVKNKQDISDAYIKVATKIVEDTTNISGLLEYTKVIDGQIMAFGSGQMPAEDFKNCADCVFYVLSEVDFHIDTKEFRKLSSLPLYTLNSALFNDIEYTAENDTLISSIIDTNALIDTYYFFIEGYLQHNMREIENDRANNVQYFKENVAEYFYLDAENLADLDVTAPYYLNMLRARMDYMHTYNENLSILLDLSRDGLGSLEQSVTLLNSGTE